MPAPPVYKGGQRKVSVLLSTADQDAPTLDTLVEILAGRATMDWELCVCERIPVEPRMTLALSRLRGTRPWIRIVTTDESVDEATAAGWAVEQATGEFVGLLAPGYIPDAHAIARLLSRLCNDSAVSAAGLIATNSSSYGPPSPVSTTDCRLLLQRKSQYLATLSRHRILTAPALAQELNKASVPTMYVALSE
jgi:hypothetical protein